MIDQNRREMFSDLYRLAEYYERPPFRDRDYDWNADWFVKAQDEVLLPFLSKHPETLAQELAFAIVDDANRLAKIANGVICPEVT